ncbi:MAG: RNA 2',3'-cyclic phosphodiesterase [Melioribacteraceae bacterium]|nr:RNA 2',3'-cyclic phosphodiesterase [Melioribacteraceae bacterium]MCF8352807.1 RNA 2',3'-cyclic phosphodiesterase [Melioribacteraceae bacterium]MCF8393473.1 RNA 2',3'-cyclic phosphodiesterase [Melioribacteraceae bacterium]MCF8417324.1 RNA 2',3'-cyclic phosphodiesterase [Melioribacteraceae bacterium]
MTNRLFIALKVPGDTLDQIVEIVKSIDPDFHKKKWENKDKLHFTLKFLGDTNTNLIPEIQNAVSVISKKYHKLRIEFNRFGVFYRNRKPVILWLGINENRELNELAEELDLILSKLGFEKERRKFKAHLTLLRIKDFHKIWVEDFTNFRLPNISCESDEISLFQSKLKPAGSVYTELQSFKLI